MATAPGLHQVQKPALQQVLAPQLQQSLHLLQMPAVELEQVVHQELQQNPLLEEEPKNEQSIEINTPEPDDPLPDEVASDDDFKREFEVLSKLDDEWREYFAQTSSFRSRSSEQQKQRQHFFDSIVQRESLVQHLLAQLDDTDLSPEDRKVAELIIGSLNDAGYLVAKLEELAVNTGLPLEQLERVLHVIQTFHPVGVGARDLRECLLIQLDRLGKSESPEAAVVALHLEDLAKKRYHEIARSLRLPLEEVQRIAAFISTLEPKPGRMFSAEPDHYIAPDVIVQEVDGEYVVLLNNEHIPHLRINDAYKEIMARADQSAEAREYVREKLRAGRFLIKCIEQRQQTIYKIARVIVEHQRDFFEKGVSHLKPLTMGQVAQKIGVHETTVSRAVANKYMQTPHGLFEMKFFFTTGFETASGAISNTSVKEQIAKLIEQEDPAAPLSDQEIVALLKKQGIPIARRTVAKYRAELNILPSNLRKKT
ncbi:MAG: RNA polymerase factor sigma-54 [Verrucomicrobiae bacterium]|nr:RNA polymerase factor sigma-54 [Verrucomicrobiae bacterium]